MKIIREDQFCRKCQEENKINIQTESKIENFILSKCERELQNSDEYNEMQKDLDIAYSHNDLEQYKKTFCSVLELRKTIFCSISAKYIHYLIK